MVRFRLDAGCHDLIRAATSLPESVMDAVLNATRIVGDTGRVIVCDPIEADEIRQWFVDAERAVPWISGFESKVTACRNAVAAIDEALRGHGGGS